MDKIFLQSLQRATQTAAQLVQSVLRPGDIAADATAGTGQDTLMLAQAVGTDGMVYAFDIQPEAIEQTRSLLEQHGLQNRVQLLCIGHEAMRQSALGEHVRGVKAIMYNLGYLPGSDHSVKTQQTTTMDSIRQAAELLADGGVMTICVYSHADGIAEAQAIENYCAGLSGRLSAYSIKRLNRDHAPYIIVITAASN